MTKKTLAALKRAIKHWERMRDDFRIKEEPSSYDCPLCKLYFFQIGCEGCPVREKTGSGECEDTPYLNASNAWEAVRADKGTEKEWKKAANCMIRFLEKLLPKEKKP